jgi:sterol desaturase/sphingolipid hydroxylase (fatty acid hydroxylase superfamily)
MYIYLFYLIPYLFFSLFFGILDYFKFSNIKRLGTGKYPSLKKYMNACPQVSINLLTIPLLEYIFIDKIYIRNTSINIFNIIISFYISSICADIWFYILHKTFHKTRFLYKNIHSKHHIYVEPFALAGLECHIVEHIFINIVSSVIGPYVLSINNMLDYNFIYLWLILIAYSTCTSHSGYNFFSNHHFDHHIYMNKHYGLYPYLCDKIEHYLLKK